MSRLCYLDRHGQYEMDLRAYALKFKARLVDPTDLRFKVT
jgi:hypothetical protein